jgi:Holliday junction DNA helicase RuvB
MFNLFRKKKEDIYEILLPGEKSQKEKPFNTPKQERDTIFEDVVGYDDIKRVIRMALKSDEPIHVLLVGPPASAKTIFLDALIRKLGDKQAYFAIGSSSTKAGVVNMLFMRAKISDGG